jgi:hypothetical protein
MRVRIVTMRLLAAVAALPVLVPSSARAQDVPLAELLPRLILSEITLQSAPAPPGIPGVPAGFSHEAHFSPLEANDLTNPAVGIVQGFNGQMATQFSTFPLGSSTGGLTYVFDESVGTFRRGSGSFGPSFAERALTIGRRRFNAGFNYQHTSYNTFEGQNLDDGSIKFYLRHEDCCTIVGQPTSPFFSVILGPNETRLDPPFEGDLIEAALSLRATTHTTAAFANYGVTDRWDIGLAVPFVSVNLDASVEARVIRLVTGANPNVHTFERGNPDAHLAVERTGHAAGLGDVVLRTKYRVLSMSGGGLAAAVDLRLPTGDEKDLLGAGGVQAKFLLVASSERGRFGQHVNVGYTAAQGEVAGTLAGLVAAPVPDEVNYSGGIEFVGSPRFTVLGDLVGRTLRGTGRLESVNKRFQYIDPTSILSPSATLTVDEVRAAGVVAEFNATEFDHRPGSLTLLLGAAGVKYNPVGNWLISGSVLFPLTDAGLRSRVTTTIGVDYAF